MSDPPYSLLQLFLNISLVGRRDAGSESLATFLISCLRPPSPRQRTLAHYLSFLVSFLVIYCTASQMQDQTPDSFNWPERPSSSDSAPDVKVEQPPGSKTFYVPLSSTPTFPSKPTTASPPSIRRHSSTGSQLRRSKHPYSPTPHEARIRNKYGAETVKMSGHNYSQHWVKSENGERHIPSVQKQTLIFPFQKLKGNRHITSPRLALRYVCSA